MPVPEPAWKVRRRPCPFYWQGKCLFADSCNFLHSINPPAPVIVVDDASSGSDSQVTDSRGSLNSSHSVQDSEHEELADDELESSSHDEHVAHSTSWSQLSQAAQAISTPPRPRPHIISRSGSEIRFDGRISEDYIEHSCSSISSHSNTGSLQSGSDLTRPDSPFAGSETATGLGLILTPISPPPTSMRSFENLGHRDTIASRMESARGILVASELQTLTRNVEQTCSPDHGSVGHEVVSTAPQMLPSPFLAQQALAHVLTSSLLSRRGDAPQSNSPPVPLSAQLFPRPLAARRVNARLRSLKNTPMVAIKESLHRDAAAYRTPVSPKMSTSQDPEVHTKNAIEPPSGTWDRDRKLRELADQALGVHDQELLPHEITSPLAVEPNDLHRVRVTKRVSVECATEPESSISTSSQDSHRTAPTWLKPLRLRTLSPSSSDDGTLTGHSSRPTSIYSTVSAHAPSILSSRSSSRTSSARPSQLLSRSTSVLRLDTAIATLSPESSAGHASPSGHTTAPLLPPAQIFTSASRSLSPPSHQPLFKLEGEIAIGPQVRPTTPTIYSPSSVTVDRAASSLFFAIASDDKAQVSHSLKDDSTSPNTRLGPQEVPALVFAITNDQLNNKLPIVKTLLENGADPTVVYDDHTKDEALAPKIDDDITPAMKYYIERAEAMSKDHTIEALKKSDLGNITAINFRLVGQDLMLKYLYRALRLYISGAVSTPFVSILAGPSGLGKSYISKQFGEILGTPAHVINLSSLRSHSSLLEMKPALADNKVTQSCTLQEFLAENEGQRCVIVLEDIEKVEDRNALHALIVPFELGRFLLSTGAYIDTSKVMWFATSSLGTKSVLEVYSPGRPMSDDEYRQTMSKARNELSEVLGASLVSRVGSVLPFVPFTDEEKSVIVCEAASTLLARVGDSYSSDKMDHLVQKIVAEHPEIDGRGLLRAVAEQF